MSNELNLIQGQTYVVIKPFVDYDNIKHNIGETWTFNSTNFLPYEDGLTLHVIVDGAEKVYRLQWRIEAQGYIIENFEQYVQLLK